MDESKEELYGRIEELHTEYNDELDRLDEELQEYHRRDAYQEKIHSTYPAVAEAYKQYLILFNLASENGQSVPDVAKAA